MLDNPKTSIVGYIMIAVILVYMAYGFYVGKPMGMQDVLAALIGIAGVGLVAAKDGGK